MKNRHGLLRAISLLTAVAMALLLMAGCGDSGLNASSSTDSNLGADSSGSSSDESQSQDLPEVGIQADIVEGAQVGEVSVVIPWELSDLAPYTRVTAARQMVLPVLYEYLGYYDPDAEDGVAPLILKTFTKIDDYTYEVEIYDYITDSEGNHFTANDVVFSMETWKENGNSVKCKCLDYAEATGDYSVRIHLTEYAGVGDIQNIVTGLCPMVTQAAYEASGDNMMENAVGTGPYTVEDYIAGASLTVVRRDDYWQTDELRHESRQANVEQVDYLIVTESSQTSINLETNMVDIVPWMSADEAARFMEGGNNADGYQVFTTTSTNFSYITFNCSEGGMFEDNALARQAFCYALDVQGIIDGYLNGQGVAMHAFANTSCVDYNSEWDVQDYYSYNLEKAKSLLEESGFDTSQTVRFMIVSDVADTLGPIYQGYFEQLGIKVEILSYDNALFQNYRYDPNEWDILSNQQQSIMYVTDAASTLQRDSATGAAQLNFAVDDTLEELCTNVVALDHTQEDVDAYMEYVNEQAYVYAIYNEKLFYAAEDGISSVFTDFKRMLLPGACTYTDQFVR